MGKHFCCAALPGPFWLALKWSSKHNVSQPFVTIAQRPCSDATNDCYDFAAVQIMQTKTLVVMINRGVCYDFRTCCFDFCVCCSRAYSAGETRIVTITRGRCYDFPQGRVTIYSAWCGLRSHPGKVVVSGLLAERTDPHICAKPFFSSDRGMLRLLLCGVSRAL